MSKPPIPSYWLLFCCLLSGLVQAQNPHPFFRNYTTEHGLPSPEVHYSLEGPDGFMWFATDNGLCRFDGYEFKVYGRAAGLTDLVVLFLQLDSRGRLWLATLSGQLFYLEGDRLHAFAGNSIIQSHSEGQFPLDFVMGRQDECYLNFTAKGILVFAADGSHQLIQARNPLGAYFLYPGPEDWLLSSTACPDSLRADCKALYGDRGVLQPLEVHDDSITYVSGQLSFKEWNNTSHWIHGISPRTQLLYLQGSLYEIKDGLLSQRRAINYRPHGKAIYQGSDGNFWIGLLGNGGIRHYSSLADWRAEHYTQFLPGKTISHIYQDSRGSLWITTVEHGIFYCPDPQLRIFDQGTGLSMDYVAAIAPASSEELFVGLRNGEVYRMNTRTDHLAMLPPVPGQQIIYDLHYDPKAHTLWVANGRNAWLEQGVWQSCSRINPHTQNPEYVIGKKFSQRTGSTRLWGINYNHFGLIDTERKQIALNSEDHGIDGRFLAILETKDGRVWLGSTTGLFEYRDDQLFSPAPAHPGLQIRVEDLAELADGTLVIATKGAGLLLWRDSTLWQLTTKEGLLSDSPENLHVDSLGRIWAGSLQGLNRISLADPDQPTTPPQVESFTNWYGLPSNQVTMVRSRGAAVWVATTKGLLRWREPPKTRDTRAPRLTQVQLNETRLSGPLPTNLSHSENNLTFHFLKLNFQQAGQIPYRYRLNADDWRYTTDRQASFARLAPGSYTFAVQSQNEDGQWSAPLTQSFTIATPWWQSGWFFMLAGIFLLGSGMGIYRYRLNILRREVAFKEQLHSLEGQALQAQMNPHFIFNCLTSIQQLILKQDSDQAMRYLTHFGKLTRATLNASIQGEVSLEEEVDMLTNYLELEKLRFKEAFAYRIDLDPTLDVSGIRFPPLLLQPFVENAVLHGMANRGQAGQIEIAFMPARTTAGLLVEITDDGPGLQGASKARPGHQSVGMSLTQRRLELLDASATRSQLEVVELTDESGHVEGTRVRVWIEV